MKVEIWSDIVCPFCFIGKRRFETALEEFEYSDDLDIEWKSFQLNASLQTDPAINLTEHLAESKGISLDQAQAMQQRVLDMAEGEDLKFNFDEAVVANSFDAHRLLQFAKTEAKGSQAKEALFAAYFTEGKNIADRQTLLEIASQIGMDPEKTKDVLESDQFSNAVKHNIQVAQSMNVQGVPFFLFDRRYAVSGAQESEVFKKALSQSWNEWLQHDEGVPTVKPNDQLNGQQ